jgi:homoserine dehydrogenase
MKLLSVGVIGYGVVGKRRIQHILKNRYLKLKYVSDLKFKKIF